MTDRKDGADEERAEGGAGAWVVIAQEPDQLSAELVVQVLRGAAIPARLAPADTMSFLGPSMLPTRILVPERWEREAHAVLARRGKADFPSSPGTL